MNRFFFILLLAQLTTAQLVMGLPGDEQPRKVVVTTTQGNRFKGLLLKTTDSALILYPGKPKDLKHGKFPKPVVFAKSSIYTVQYGKQKPVKFFQSGTSTRLFTKTQQPK